LFTLVVNLVVRGNSPDDTTLKDFFKLSTIETFIYIAQFDLDDQYYRHQISPFMIDFHV